MSERPDEIVRGRVRLPDGRTVDHFGEHTTEDGSGKYYRIRPTKITKACEWDWSPGEPVEDNNANQE